MKNKTLELVSVIIGCFIGAGFVSGREVAVYFAQFGLVSIATSILQILLFYIFVKMCLIVGKKYNVCDNNMSCIVKKYDNLAFYIIIICTLINVGSMVAGSKAIGVIFGSNSLEWILPLCMLLLTFIFLCRKYSGLAMANFLLVPMLVILILVISVTTCFTAGTMTLPDTNLFVNIFGALGSSIVYVFFNMLLLGVLLIQIGHKYSYREIKSGAIISSIIIGVLILIISMSIILSGDNVLSSDMPLLQESINLDYYFSIVFAICQFCGIFTTILSSTFIATNMIADKGVNYYLSMILVMIAGILISFIGFANIVNYLYKLTGTLSFVFFAILFKCLYIDPKCNAKKFVPVAVKQA